MTADPTYTEPDISNYCLHQTVEESLRILCCRLLPFSFSMSHFEVPLAAILVNMCDIMSLEYKKQKSLFNKHSSPHSLPVSACLHGAWPAAHLWQFGCLLATPPKLHAK